MICWLVQVPASEAVRFAEQHDQVLSMAHLPMPLEPTGNCPLLLLLLLVVVVVVAVVVPPYFCGVGLGLNKIQQAGKPNFVL